MGGPGSGKKPREYPPEIVSLAIELYESGLGVREVSAALPKGFKAQRILERYAPDRKRHRADQRGPKNALWKSEPGYQAAHLRVASQRGKARQHACVDCGERAVDWSYVGDCSDELRTGARPAYCLHASHYEPRCRPCHRAYDRKEVETHA